MGIHRGREADACGDPPAGGDPSEGIEGCVRWADFAGLLCLLQLGGLRRPGFENFNPRCFVGIVTSCLCCGVKSRTAWVVGEWLRAVAAVTLLFSENYLAPSEFYLLELDKLASGSCHRLAVLL